MAFTEIELARIKKIVGGFCGSRSPAHIRDKLRYDYKVQNQAVIIYEIRPQWDDPEKKIEAPLAKLNFVKNRNVWNLYWQGANMKWNKYEQFESSADIVELVNAINDDRCGCFFG